MHVWWDASEGFQSCAGVVRPERIFGIYLRDVDGWVLRDVYIPTAGKVPEDHYYILTCTW